MGGGGVGPRQTPWTRYYKCGLLAYDSHGGKDRITIALRSVICSGFARRLLHGVIDIVKMQMSLPVENVIIPVLVVVINSEKAVNTELERRRCGWCHLADEWPTRVTERPHLALLPPPPPTTTTVGASQRRLDADLRVPHRP